MVKHCRKKGHDHNMDTGVRSRERTENSDYEGKSVGQLCTTKQRRLVQKKEGKPMQRTQRRSRDVQG